MAKSMPQASARGTGPAPRSSMVTPLGVSIARMVSSIDAESNVDHDGIGDAVMQALTRAAEDQQHIDQRIDIAKHRDHLGEYRRQVAEKGDAAEIGSFAIASDDAATEQALANGLSAAVGQIAVERQKGNITEQARSRLVGDRIGHDPTHLRSGRGAATRAGAGEPDPEHHEGNGEDEGVNDRGSQPPAAAG